MKRLLIAAALFCVAMAGGALAQTAATTTPDVGPVAIPVGAWVAGSAGILAIGLAYVARTVVNLVIAALPAQIGALIKTVLTEQFLARAIDFAVNAVVGATKDKVLDVDTGNKVLNTALGYFVKYAPDWLWEYLGATKDNQQPVTDRFIARLDLHPTVGVAHDGTLIALTPPPPAPAG